jgi:3-oxoacyl-[acyl-carrier-protein] synthase II
MMTRDWKRRVVITGIGVVSPMGIGAEAFWDGLSRGVSGIDDISRFDTMSFRSKRAAIVQDFECGKMLGRKECWSGSRSVSFALAAAKSALDHAGIEITSENQSSIGVSLGTTLACLNLMAKLDQQALREGPRTTDPALFPDTGVSAPACRISIMFGMRAFNVTLSNGATSGLDAIHYGVDAVRKGYAHTVLAGGMEEICKESFIGVYAQGLLSPGEIGEEEMCRPFDRRRSGTILGEGCAIVVLEDLEHARARGAHIWAEVIGYGTAFDPTASLSDGGGEAGCRAMRLALKDSAVMPDQVDLVFSNANSGRIGDIAESDALRCVFGQSSNLFVTATKSMLGESYSASGALQIAACAMAMEHGIIPPTINCEEPDPKCQVRQLVREPHETSIRIALANSSGWAGNAASLVLSTSDL